ALIGSLVPYLLVGILGGGFWLEHNYQERQKGARDERIRQLTTTNDSLVKVAKVYQHAYRVDTVRLTKTLTRRDTVLQSVTRYLHDTVAVPVEVVRRI